MAPIAFHARTLRIGVSRPNAEIAVFALRDADFDRNLAVLVQCLALTHFHGLEHFEFAQTLLRRSKHFRRIGLARIDGRLLADELGINAFSPANACRTEVSTRTGMNNQRDIQPGIAVVCLDNGIADLRKRMAGRFQFKNQSILFFEDRGGIGRCAGNHSRDTGDHPRSLPAHRHLAEMEDLTAIDADRHLYRPFPEILRRRNLVDGAPGNADVDNAAITRQFIKLAHQPVAIGTGLGEQSQRAGDRQVRICNEVGGIPESSSFLVGDVHRLEGNRVGKRIGDDQFVLVGFFEEIQGSSRRRNARYKAHEGKKRENRHWGNGMRAAGHPLRAASAQRSRATRAVCIRPEHPSILFHIRVNR